MVILSHFSQIGFLIRKSQLVDFERLVSKNLQRCSKVFLLSPNPLLMLSANVKDSENADRWLTALSSAIVR